MTPETRKQQLERISVDPQVCFGKPVIRGTRIWVSLILDWLADGKTFDEIIINWPYITQEDILACLAYGAEASRSYIVDVPTRAAS